MMNKEDREAAYKRILEDIENEISQQSVEGIKVYIAIDSWVNYYPKLNVYKGYCAVRRARFCINIYTIMEYAAHSENIHNLMASLQKANHFDVATEGGGMLPIGYMMQEVVLYHFWTQYKALTG